MEEANDRKKTKSLKLAMVQVNFDPNLCSSSVACWVSFYIIFWLSFMVLIEQRQ